MGSKSTMLRKFLIVLGLASIVFGALSFIAFNYTFFKALTSAEFEYAHGWQKPLAIISNLQITASNAIQEMAIGGICLFLAHKIRPFGDKS